MEKHVVLAVLTDDKVGMAIILFVLVDMMDFNSSWRCPS